MENMIWTTKTTVRNTISHQNYLFDYEITATFPQTTSFTYSGNRRFDQIPLVPRQRLGHSQHYHNVYAMGGYQRNRKLHHSPGRPQELLFLHSYADRHGDGPQVCLRSLGVAQRSLRAHAGWVQGGTHGIPLLVAV